MGSTISQNMVFPKKSMYKFNSFSFKNFVFLIQINISTPKVQGFMWIRRLYTLVGHKRRLYKNACIHTAERLPKKNVKTHLLNQSTKSLSQFDGFVRLLRGTPVIPFSTCCIHCASSQLLTLACSRNCQHESTWHVHYCSGVVLSKTKVDARGRGFHLAIYPQMRF